MGQDHIVHKTAFTGRSVFDAIRISQIPKQSIKNKATVNALVVCIVLAFEPKPCHLRFAHADGDVHAFGRRSGFIICMHVGLSALLVPIDWAMREPL